MRSQKKLIESGRKEKMLKILRYRTLRRKFSTHCTFEQYFNANADADFLIWSFDWSSIFKRCLTSGVNQGWAAYCCDQPVSWQNEYANLTDMTSDGDRRQYIKNYNCSLAEFLEVTRIQGPIELTSPHAQLLRRMKQLPEYKAAVAEYVRGTNVLFSQIACCDEYFEHIWLWLEGPDFLCKLRKLIKKN